MQDDLCELRLDVPLDERDDVPAFERAWRTALTARRLGDAAKPTAVRFRLCRADLSADRSAAWVHYLSARFAALPGAPAVAAMSMPTGSDWKGVNVWLAYPAPQLTALLQRSRTRTRPSSRTRGHHENKAQP